jgi:hypothetical protein
MRSLVDSHEISACDGLMSAHTFQPENRVTDFDEVWYECCAVEDHLTF